MLTRFFDNTRPITVLLLFAALAIISVVNNYTYFNNEQFQNAYLIAPFYQSLGSVMQYVLSIVLVLSLGFLVNFIVHDNSITRDNSFALLFFVILVASDKSISIINPILVSVLFLYLALKNLLSLHEHKNMPQKLFNTGLLLGIASVIYPDAIFFSVLIFIGIVIYGIDSWRQWFLPILGLIIPYYFLFSWYFWFDDLSYFWDNFFIKTLSISEIDFHHSGSIILEWGVFAILTIISIFDYSKNMSSHKPDTRKGYTMAYLSLFIGVFTILVGKVSNGQEFIILFLPLSIIWAKFIQHQKKELYKTLFLVAVVTSIFISFLYKLYLT